jgi:polar amino acid transport system substrate-binding protein
MKKCLAVSLMHAGLALAGSLALAGMASAQSCTPKVSASALIKPGTLVMSTNPTLPPMPFVDRASSRACASRWATRSHAACA